MLLNCLQVRFKFLYRKNPNHSSLHEYNFRESFVSENNVRSSYNTKLKIPFQYKQIACDVHFFLTRHGWAG